MRLGRRGAECGGWGVRLGGRGAECGGQAGCGWGYWWYSLELQFLLSTAEEAIGLNHTQTCKQCTAI